MLAVLAEAHARRYFTALNSAEQLSAFSFKEHQLLVCAGSDCHLSTGIEQHLQVIGNYLSVWIGALLPNLFKPLSPAQGQILVVPSED